MERRFGFAVANAALVVRMACGGSNSACSAVPPPPSEGTAEQALVLEPVSAPRELFAVARVKSIAKLADVGIRWTSLPVDWRSLFAKELPGLERVLAFDAPVDCAATLDPSSIEPHVFWAFSFGVASADAAASYFRNQGDSVLRRGPGVYAVRLEGLNCVVAPARGAAAARVVCSDGMDSVDAL